MAYETTNETIFRHPRKVTIVESIVAQIVEQIQQGKLSPGERLPSERQLIEIFNVSRSSVREALQGLMVMGLVESRPGMGTFISAARSRLSPSLLSSPALADRLQRQMRLQLVEARRTIEPAITRLAAERATPEQVALLRQRFDDYKRDPFATASSPQFPSAHLLIHLTLAEMSGNPFLIATVDNLLHAVPEALRRREAIGLAGQETEKITLDEIAMHSAIVEAVARGDGDAVYKAMDDHLDYERRLVEQLFPVEMPD